MLKVKKRVLENHLRLQEASRFPSVYKSLGGRERLPPLPLH